VELAGFTEVLVYPRIHPLDALGPGVVSVAGTTKSSKRRLEDISRPVGIRDYVAGESIRHVHWKATAHTQSLKVKTFEATGHDDWVVVLDLVPEHYRSWNVTSMSRSEEHTSELQSRENLVCRLLLEKKKKKRFHSLLIMR